MQSNERRATEPEWLANIKRQYPEPDWIFRGESELFPKVSTSLYRWMEANGHGDKDVQAVQQSLTNVGLAHLGEGWMPRPTDGYHVFWSGEWDPTKYGHNEINWLGEVQHWGGKTNLLDFSTDLHVALFFACLDSPEKQGRLITIPRHQQETLPALSPEHRSEAQQSIFVVPPKGYLETYESMILSPEQKEQGLLYLAKGGPGISLESLYKDTVGYVYLEDRYLEAVCNYLEAKRRSDANPENTPEQARLIDRATKSVSPCLPPRAVIGREIGSISSIFACNSLMFRRDA